MPAGPVTTNTDGGPETRRQQRAPSREPGWLGLLLARDRCRDATAARRHPVSSRTRCRTRRRSARRRRPSPGCPPPTPTPARSPSAGRTTTTPTGHLVERRDGNQTAQTYRIQVAPDPSFSVRSPTRRRSTRRPTPRSTGCTPTARTTGACRPIDAQNNGLTFSPVASFTKASPAVVPSSPVGGALVSGTTPLRWNAQAFAASYTVEVYKNNDQTFSAANRIFTSHGADHLGGADRPDPGLQRAVPVARPPGRLGRQPGPVVGDRVVHLVRHGAEPAHAQGLVEDPRHDRVLRVDRGAGSGEVRAEPQRRGRQQAADRGDRVRRPVGVRDRPVQLERDGARRGRQPARDECRPHGEDRLDVADRQEGEAGSDQADLHHLDQVQREGEGRLEEVGRAGQGPADRQVQEAQGQDLDRQEEDDGQGQPEGPAAARDALPGAAQHEEDPRQGGQPARTEHRGPDLPPAAPGARGRRSAGPRRPGGTTECRAPSARLRECVGEPGHGSSLAP